MAGPGHPGRSRPGQGGEVMRPRLPHLRRLPGGSAPHRRELRHAGVVGLFAQAHGTWRLVGPTLPSSLDNGRAEVLGLWTSQSTTVAMVAVTTASGTAVLAAWSEPAGGWATSVPLAVSSNEQVASFGPGRGKDVFVLLRDAFGADQLALAQGGGAAWQQLPPPPPGTATVAFGPSTPPDALVANGTKFSVWSLDAGSKRWAEDQVIDRPAPVWFVIVTKGRSGSSGRAPVDLRGGLRSNLGAPGRRGASHCQPRSRRSSRRLLSLPGLRGRGDNAEAPRR